MATPPPPIKLGSMVEVIGKGIVGKVAYIGSTLFSSGKWIGVALNEAKGKNNGSVQGKKYFTCLEDHGIFVRQSQLAIYTGDQPAAKTPSQATPSPATPSLATPKPVGMPRKAGSMEDIAAKQQQKKAQNRLSMSGLRPPSVGKTSFSRRSIATPDAESDGGSSGRSTPKGVEASPILDAPPSTVSKQTPPTAPVREEKAPPMEEKRTSITDISAMSASITDKMETLHQMQEISNLRTELKDMDEKLETLKIKRADDKLKLKELQKLKIQIQQLQEYKTKMQETQGDLQRQLQASKKEAKDSQEAFEIYKDEMADFAETVELATLDKEMAEEKNDSLQEEVDSQKEKLEEVTLDLQILKEELNEAASSDGVATNYQVKQLEQQQERLKEALVKLRDLSNHEKGENQRLQKQLDIHKAEASSLGKEKDKMTANLQQLEEEVIELKEQVDAAQGAAEMVEQLTEKTLEVEESIQQLQEEKADLEALCELNDELHESTRETELELHEEVDMARAHAADLASKLEATHETIVDYDSTINKFRQLVVQLQEQNDELRSKQASAGAAKSDLPTIEIVDFKTKFAEVKAHTKAIDMELRKLEVSQANQHISYLTSFMPDSFSRHGGDRNGVLVLLLIPRLLAKTDLLINQIRDKFDVPDVLQREHVFSSHNGTTYVFVKNFIYELCVLQGVLRQYEQALGGCSAALLLKIGTLLQEFVSNEMVIDSYIELLRQDQLDETVSLDKLNGTIRYFQHQYSVHLTEEPLDGTHILTNITQVFLAACDCLNIDISCLKLSLQPGQETSDTSILLRDIENYVNEVKVSSRKVKRRIPQQGGTSAPLSFSNEVKEKLESGVETVKKLILVLQQAASGALQQASILVEGTGLTVQKMMELLTTAYGKTFGQGDTVFSSFRELAGSVAEMMKQVAVAMENGEYDFDGTSEKKPIPPIVVRAQSVKAELADSEKTKLKLEKKDEDIKELKRLLKLKQEELSEQQVRVGLLEKKLENATKDTSGQLEKVQGKLDVAGQLLKQKQKEFDETIDALQGDIEALEGEKADLKEKIKLLSKKTLLDGLGRSGSNQSDGIAAGLTGLPPGEGTNQSPMLLQQVGSLRKALQVMRNENLRLKNAKMKAQLASLPRLDVPKKPTGLFVKCESSDRDAASREDLTKLAKDANGLLKELYYKCACPKVVDITKRKPGGAPITETASPFHQLVQSASSLAGLQRKTTELQVQVTTLLAANRTGGQVRTDFSTFPTPEFARVLHEKAGSSECVGNIRIPVTAGSGSTLPIQLQPQELLRIHSRFLS